MLQVTNAKKPVTKVQPIHICSHRIQKTKLLLTGWNPLIIQKFVFMICFKGAPPFFSPILSYLFNNVGSFYILHSEGGNNYMPLWWQLVLLLLLQMETATNSPANIYLYASFSSLSVYSQ